MVVVAVMRLPHRMGERAIGGLELCEFRGDADQAPERIVGLCGCVAVLELDDPFFTGGLPAAGRHIYERRSSGVSWDSLRSAPPQHCWLAGQLPRQAAFHQAVDL